MCREASHTSSIERYVSGPANGIKAPGASLKI
jgi:hypothetical protein